ncbi:MAG: response regulator [bacterium]|nr:response regulator [bacterium]
MTNFFPKPPVVLLEPDYFWREILSRHLEERGLLVYKFDQGWRAARFLHINRPKIFVTEIILPDAPGEFFIRDLRSSPRLSGLQILVVTADSSRNSLERCLSYGVNSYHQKSQSSMLQIVEAICSRVAEPS